MSGRSSQRELLAGACAAIVVTAACGKRGPTKPETDPAQVTKLAATMLREIPTPAAARDCTPADMNGGVSMTFRSLTLLGGSTPAKRPEDAE